MYRVLLTHVNLHFVKLRQNTGASFATETRLRCVMVEDFEAVRWLHTRNVSARHATMFFLISRAGIFAASAFSTSAGNSLSDAKRRASN
jgi:hypothetical protein